MSGYVTIGVGTTLERYLGRITEAQEKKAEAFKSIASSFDRWVQLEEKRLDRGC